MPHEYVAGHTDQATKLLDALGIDWRQKPVKDVTMKVVGDDLANVAVTYYARVPEFEQMIEIVKHYKLVEAKSPEDEAADVERQKFHMQFAAEKKRVRAHVVATARELLLEARMQIPEGDLHNRMSLTAQQILDSANY